LKELRSYLEVYVKNYVSKTSLLDSQKLSWLGRDRLIVVA
jgi:hypothetical protein